jgi:hypothetical protein
MAPHLNKFELPSSKDILFTKFDWIWSADSGEDFLKFSVYFYYFAIISP